MSDLFDLSPADWLRTHGATLVPKLPGYEGHHGWIEVELIRRTQTSIVMRLTLSGSGYMIKVFDPDAQGSRTALDREITLLELLAPAGLSARLAAYSRKNGYMVTEEIAGDVLEKKIKPKNAVAMAEALGRWYRKIDDVLPGRRDTGDWLSYLSQVEGQGVVSVPGAKRGILRSLPIERRVLAKNDAHLSNFIVNGDHLVGIDFESATFKPMGWDVLATARVLARTFPKARQPVVDSLLRESVRSSV